MVTLLTLLYFTYGFLLFYTYTKGYSLLRYLLKKKNINFYISIELIFIILCSLIVFVSQPTNWLVGLIMLLHIAGVIWLISDPDSLYSLTEDPSMDFDSLEVASAIVIIGLGVLAYLSNIL